MSTLVAGWMVACLVAQICISRSTAKREAWIEKCLKSMRKLSDGFCLMLTQHLEQIDRMEEIAEDFRRSQGEGEEWKR